MLQGWILWCIMRRDVDKLKHNEQLSYFSTYQAVMRMLPCLGGKWRNVKRPTAKLKHGQWSSHSPLQLGITLTQRFLNSKEMNQEHEGWPSAGIYVHLRWMWGRYTQNKLCPMDVTFTYQDAGLDRKLSEGRFEINRKRVHSSAAQLAGVSS